MRPHLPERYQATVDCGRGLGMRQGEILGFSPEDVNWLQKDKVVHIRRQVTHDRGTLVFTTRERKPLNKNYFNYFWKSALEAIGAITAINDMPVG
ncbi:hypothetical protein ACIQVR_11220 [Streptomyces xanthochromogenes]|uniref:hypothetical protein n=1 Tax=Streptomyces xanthochromogenes TaxID=67384 RepID=UPI003802274B